MIKVLITGPESSGKSTLAAQLSEYFEAPFVREFAREYLNNCCDYRESDLLQIAIGQHRAESEAANNKPLVLFCDTGMEVIEIWSREKYGRINAQILRLSKEVNYDLVLLCTPNIPWQPDPLRENPTDRTRLYNLYKMHLSAKPWNVLVIDAETNNRKNQAIKYVLEAFPVLKSKNEFLD